jgi:SAM-dependent methyltransferase
LAADHSGRLSFKGVIELAACPVCDGRSFVEVYLSAFSGDWRDALPYFLTARTQAAHGRIVRCMDCGFLFTSPQFSALEYACLYDAVRAANNSIPPKTRFDALAKRVRQTESGGKFLDFGCGSGAFLDAMRGFEGIGFELAAEGLRRNGQIVIGDILSDHLSCFGLSPGSFDFIVAWDVLEHLPEPAHRMLRLKTLLKPGGRLYLTTPDSSSWVARLTGEKWNMLLLEHLWYFSPATLRRFLGRCGFTPRVISPILYPIDLGTVFLRLRQTYGSLVPLAPASLGKVVVKLPVGLMFAAAISAAR